MGSKAYIRAKMKTELQARTQASRAGLPARPHQELHSLTYEFHELDGTDHTELLAFSVTGNQNSQRYAVNFERSRFDKVIVD
jgi:hypothetical protein